MALAPGLKRDAQYRRALEQWPQHNLLETTLAPVVYQQAQASFPSMIKRRPKPRYWEWQHNLRTNTLPFVEDALSSIVFPSYLNRRVVYRKQESYSTPEPILNIEPLPPGEEEYPDFIHRSPLYRHQENLPSPVTLLAVEDQPEGEQSFQDYLPRRVKYRFQESLATPLSLSLYLPDGEVEMPIYLFRKPLYRNQEGYPRANLVLDELEPEGYQELQGRLPRKVLYRHQPLYPIPTPIAIEFAETPGPGSQEYPDYRFWKPLYRFQDLYSFPLTALSEGEQPPNGDQELQVYLVRKVLYRYQEGYSVPTTINIEGAEPLPVGQESYLDYIFRKPRYRFQEGYRTPLAILDLGEPIPQGQQEYPDYLYQKAIPLPGYTWSTPLLVPENIPDGKRYYPDYLRRVARLNSGFTYLPTLIPEETIPEGNQLFPEILVYREIPRTHLSYSSVITLAEVAAPFIPTQGTYLRPRPQRQQPFNLPSLLPLPITGLPVGSKEFDYLRRRREYRHLMGLILQRNTLLDLAPVGDQLNFMPQAERLYRQFLATGTTEPLFEPPFRILSVQFYEVIPWGPRFPSDLRSFILVPFFGVPTAPELFPGNMGIQVGVPPFSLTGDDK